MNMHVPHALLQTPEKIIGHEIADGVEFPFSPQLRAYFNKDQHAIWSRWKPSPRPCFNPALLGDLRAYYDFIERSGAQIQCGEEPYPLEYCVQASAIPGVFNLGGDLDLFKQLIDSHARASLLSYGRACVDLVYSIYQGYHLPVTTIALVQGESLGGGFEAALPNDVIIAEKSARFGFPEILFNLFPGMGACTFLERRVGRRTTEELLSSGKIYSAGEMLALGVIDLVAEDGQGEAEVAALIKRRQRSQNGLTAMAAARRRAQRIEVSELLDIVELWVDSALRLTPRDIKLMQRLVSRQNSLGDSQQVH